jgi:hypothetical protein
MCIAPAVHEREKTTANATARLSVHRSDLEYRIAHPPLFKVGMIPETAAAPRAPFPRTNESRA